MKVTLGILPAILAAKGHKGIFGRTGTGKTSVAIELMLVYGGPCLFFNTQHLRPERSARGHSGLKRFVKADMDTPKEFILDALRRGGKVDYWPSLENLSWRVKELESLVGMVFSDVEWSPRLKFVGDEAHLYSSKGRLGPLEMLATTGRTYGIDLFSVTQRPASVNHALLTQTEQHLIFQLEEYERGYLESYKISYDDLMQRLSANPHGFVTRSLGITEGPFLAPFTG